MGGAGPWGGGGRGGGGGSDAAPETPALLEALTDMYIRH